MVSLISIARRSLQREVADLSFFRHFQTLRIQYAISSLCCMTLTIHGCSSISFGEGRAVGSRVSLEKIRS